jgi:hypothetical protein
MQSDNVSRYDQRRPLFPGERCGLLSANGENSKEDESFYRCSLHIHIYMYICIYTHIYIHSSRICEVDHKPLNPYVLHFRRVLFTIKLLHKCFHFLCSILMLFWTTLCVLRRTCRQSSLYETLFHCNTLSKHHHHSKRKSQLNVIFSVLGTPSEQVNLFINIFTYMYLYLCIYINMYYVARSFMSYSHAYLGVFMFTGFRLFYRWAVLLYL